MKYLKQFLKATLLMTAVFVICFLPTTAAVAAKNYDVYCITQGDCPVYDPNSCSNTPAAGDTPGGVSGSSGSSTWSSGSNSPYYMEDFIINVLKDTAKKLNASESDAVTQEHVVAMLGWAGAEGGNTHNTGWFNLWNTGLLSRPDLVAGGTSASGLQAFKSFDAGVEANAISLTTSNQNRIGKILVKPNSTAEDVEHAIAYYDNTPGNKAWAWGPNPNDPGSVLSFNHTTYIKSLLDQLKATRQNYSDLATTVIGPSEQNAHHVPKSKLKFNGGSDHTAASDADAGAASAGCPSSSDTPTSGSPDCASAAGSEKIICEAKKYDPISYEESAAGGHLAGGNSAWHKTCPKIGPSCVLDCSGLVSVAVYDAFGNNTTWVTFTIVSDHTNWKEVSFGDLKPGDVIEPNTGHVEIVDHVSGGAIFTFGAHSSHYPQPRQVSPAQFAKTDANRYFRYVGQGV